jgi:hypothetical protein
LGRKEESADLLTTNSGSTTLLGRGNDDYGKHLLLPAVKRWQQQIRTLSQGQKIASLAIHKTRGCNILAGGTTWIRGTIQLKKTTKAQRRTFTDEGKKIKLGGR